MAEESPQRNPFMGSSPGALGYIAGHVHTSDPRYGVAEKPKLVPCRRGGPWHKSGHFWERWHGGTYVSHGNGHGYIYEPSTGKLYCNGNHVTDYIPGDELRAPKEFKGPPPEGCYFVDFQPGDKVRLDWEVKGKCACALPEKCEHDGEIAAIVKKDGTRCSGCPGSLQSWRVQPPHGSEHCWSESHMTHEPKEPK